MKNNVSLSVLMLLFFSSICIAQPDYQNMMGLIFDKQTEKAAKENLPSNYDLGRKADNLPLIYSLKDFAPTPRDQFEGTCVGYSISNALSICLAHSDSIVSQSDKDKNVISATFIYNNIKAENHSCKEGARIPDGFDLLKEKGSCKAILFEDTAENCNRLPNDKAVIEDAATNKIKDYISVFDPDDEDIMRKVYKTKEQLAMGLPVVIGMNMPTAFLLKHDFQKPIDLSSNTEINGGHAMCVIGYDIHREAFEVMNSWGKGWGNGGFFWLSFEDYAKYVKCGFAPILEDKKAAGNTSKNESVTTLTGEFSFRTPNGFDQHGKPDFKENTPEFDGKNYIINDWKRFKVYQLVGKGMKRNSYTYVFSIDAKDTVALHFPESVETLNSQDLMTADKVPLLKKAIVQDQRETIVIPGEYYALQTVYRGTDNICVIYSDNNISDIQERIEITRKSTAKNIHKRLNEGFRDILIPSKDVDYDEDKMAFTATSRRGSAVPIILQVVVK